MLGRERITWTNKRQREDVPSRRDTFLSWSQVGCWGAVEWIKFAHLDPNAELSEGTRLPMSAVFGSDHGPYWEKWLQPVALLWKTIFVNTNNMGRSVLDLHSQTLLVSEIWDARTKAIELGKSSLQCMAISTIR